ncbi:hypothetical protein BP6252_13499 [Coleophoma cylindrospora]|uniref:Rhodopsin domain-containing protein n=1 Tax=Coleophoma cylindrospora TaxID=1849047 RepID=A0A3D8Q8Y2_9HELO|nr:hypothetical protein BP6252_13499 [Coleophoma cylindrospora]
MQQPPLSQILAWPTPNYINPSETRGDGNVVLNIVLYAVLIFFMSLRIFTRAKLMQVFGADDIFILCAMIPTTAFFVISLLAHTRFLWIRHVYDIPVENVTTGLKMVLATEVMFATACTLVKLSMLMLVRRMLSNASLFWRRITLLAIVVVILQGSVFCLTVLFQCRPPQDYWKITVDPQPNCINQGASLLVAGIVNTLTDFICVVLPIRTVWHLQLHTRQMLIVVTLFGLGFISCIAGCVRTYYMYLVLKTWDTTWASFPVWVSAAVELYVGIICASIPATKPFFTTYLPAIFGSLTTVSATQATISARDGRASHFTPRDTVMDAEMADFEKNKASRNISSITSAADDKHDRESIISAQSDYHSTHAHKQGGGIRVTQAVDQLSDSEPSGRR